MKTNNRFNESDLLPLHIIKAASEGNEDALYAVLKHYDTYILSLSMRRGYNETGIPYYYIDETLRGRLQTKLLTKALNFEMQ